MKLTTKSLLSSRFGTDDYLDDDPMSSMGNLMDVMLVFACGLMIALIAHYDVDFSPNEVTKDDATKTTLDVEQVTTDSFASEDALLEIGTVYRDPDTGELYIKSDEDLEK